MRHTFIVVTVKKTVKIGVYIYIWKLSQNVNMGITSFGPPGSDDSLQSVLSSTRKLLVTSTLSRQCLDIV